MSNNTKKRLFKINATTVIWANCKEHVSDALQNQADIWAFEESDILEVNSVKELPKGWGEFSCPAVADLVYSKDPWANTTVLSLLNTIDPPNTPKTAEERLAELEEEIRKLKQLISK